VTRKQAPNAFVIGSVYICRGVRRCSSPAAPGGRGSFSPYHYLLTSLNHHHYMSGQLSIDLLRKSILIKILGSLDRDQFVEADAWIAATLPGHASSWKEHDSKLHA
jgi:hypothetical protein